MFLKFCTHKFLIFFFKDEESQCETYESEKCIHEVRLKIGKKSAEIRKSYTLSMFTPQGNEGKSKCFNKFDLFSRHLHAVLLAHKRTYVHTHTHTRRERQKSFPI